MTFATDSPTHSAAHRWGIADGYVGADENFHAFSPPSLAAVITALELSNSISTSPDSSSSPLPPVAVLTTEEPHSLPFESVPPADLTWQLRSEEGILWDLSIRIEDSHASLELPRLSDELPIGYHHVFCQENPDWQCRLILTPPRLVPHPQQLHTWGVMAQIYAVRGPSSWGIGDCSDLRIVCEWAAEAGADFVQINPIHAGSVTHPQENSPYLPRSRRFFHPLMIAIPELPEWSMVEIEVRHGWEELAAPLVARNTTTDLLDRDAVWSIKLKVLTELWDIASHPLPESRFHERWDHFVEYCEHEGEALRDFALWCALTERWGEDYSPLWDGRHGPSSAWAQDQAQQLSDRVLFFQWLQWLVSTQLTETQAAARAAGMSIGIIHDLAVGVSRTSADLWTLPEVMVPQLTVGAPPDAYNQCGQNWNQPPWHPRNLRSCGYEPFIRMIRTLCMASGGIRIDHILGLFRLWCIPDKELPTAGVYVPFPVHDLLRIIVLEATRHDCVVIGEDLGTVMPEMATTLANYGIWGTSVLWYEYYDGALVRPEDMRRECLMTASTHDMPPVAGYLAGDQVDLRESLGILGQSREAEYHDFLRTRSDMQQLAESCGVWPETSTPGDTAEVMAVHKLLWMTPSYTRALALVDIVGQRSSQNVPGTDREYPNWCIPLTDRHGMAVNSAHLPPPIGWN